MNYGIQLNVGEKIYQVELTLVENYEKINL